jgi:hypothetical protein
MKENNQAGSLHLGMRSLSGVGQAASLGDLAVTEPGLVAGRRAAMPGMATSRRRWQYREQERASLDWFRTTRSNGGASAQDTSSS